MNFTLLLKTLRDRWRSSVAWAAGAVALSSIQLYIYPSVVSTGDVFDEFIKAFPKEFIAMFRIEDYTSGVGFLGTELFSMMIPLVFISVGSSWGASAAAEEEEKGTSEILYALPISRTRIIISKIVAAWAVMIAIGVVLVVVITIGSSMVDLDLKNVHLVAATTSCLALGIFFHGLAIMVGGLVGKRGAALGLAFAIGLVSFLIYSLAPLVDTFDAVLPFMPFEWAIGAKPLKTGFDLVGIGWLLLGALIGYVIALFAINRRDIDA